VAQDFGATIELPKPSAEQSLKCRRCRWRFCQGVALGAVYVGVRGTSWRHFRAHFAGSEVAPVPTRRRGAAGQLRGQPCRRASCP